MIKEWLDGAARRLGYLTPEDVAVMCADLKVQMTPPSKLAQEALSSEEPQGAGTRSIPVPQGYIRYFVSYSFSVRNSCASGNGCTEIARSKPVRNYDDIQWMINGLKPIVAKSAGVVVGEVTIVINNWTRFEEDAPDGAREPVESADAPPQQIVLRLVA